MSLTIEHRQRRLWAEMISEEGALRAPSHALEQAYYATPRHPFIHIYRTWDNPGWRADDLDEIYSDQSLILSGEPEQGVLSSASQPSYILDLVNSLDIRPGHRILEIGSGCGWLLAVMAHMTGPTGRAHGIEILPGLVKQSREILADYRNVMIHRGDGRHGYQPGALYDRIISTCALETIPPALLRQAAPGARLLLPIATGDATRCEVTLYERAGRGLTPIEARVGFFVPMMTTA